MLKKAYLEITNACNLRCSFCHGTKREIKFLSTEEFTLDATKLRGVTEYLYFHLMGEPLLHPSFPRFVKRAWKKGFYPILTTNGSLLAKCGQTVLENLPYKISISLHAPEANAAFAADGYLESCIDFAKEAAERGCIIALRLWNLGSGADNSHILDFLHASFPSEWRDIRGGSSQRLAERIFLEWGERFDWPDPALPECPPDTDLFCYGLRDQIGVLVDGTVVPCCLDADGNLALGNLFDTPLREILASPRARAIYEGFTVHRAEEALCRRCGYARRFSTKPPKK
jgi:radical SAM protein with 4Fe4S-binding SPASM domain